MRNWKLVLLALAASTALIAGCGSDDGGDGGGDGTGGEALSNEEFSAAVCDVVVPLGDEINAIQGETNNPQQVVDQLQQGEQVISDAVDELQALEPPEDAVQAKDTLVDALDTLRAGFTEFRQAVEDANGDPTAVIAAAGKLPTTVQEFQSGVEEAAQQAQEADLNLNDC